MGISVIRFQKHSSKLTKTGLHIVTPFDQNLLQKGIYLVLLHADHIPPHLGLLINDQYHSLSVKGQEVEIPGEVLRKSISVRKICSVFIAIRKHPVFSYQYLSEAFAEQVKLFDRVDEEENTCMSPVRLFFEEFYGIPGKEIQLLFDLLEQLTANDFIVAIYGLNLGVLDGNIFYLQPYNRQDLKKQIKEAILKMK